MSSQHASTTSADSLRTPRYSHRDDAELVGSTSISIASARRTERL